jgi:hypothetical protein
VLFRSEDARLCIARRSRFTKGSICIGDGHSAWSPPEGGEGGEEVQDVVLVCHAWRHRTSWDAVGAATARLVVLEDPRRALLQCAEMMLEERELVVPLRADELRRGGRSDSSSRRSGGSTARAASARGDDAGGAGACCSAPRARFTEEVCALAPGMGARLVLSPSSTEIVFRRFRAVHLLGDAGRVEGDEDGEEAQDVVLASQLYSRRTRLRR